MGFGRTASARRSAAQKHAQRERECLCGKIIFGNAYYAHRNKCRIADLLKELRKQVEGLEKTCDRIPALREETKVRLVSFRAALRTAKHHLWIRRCSRCDVPDYEEKGYSCPECNPLKNAEKFK